MLTRSPLRVLLCLFLGVPLLSALISCALLFPPRPPIASFEVRYYVDEEDIMVVALDARASSSPDDKEIVSYMWVFYDDAVVTPKVYTGTYDVPVIWVRYPDEGQYSPVLTVVDERGLMSDPVTQPVILPPGERE